MESHRPRRVGLYVLAFSLAARAFTAVATQSHPGSSSETLNAAGRKNTNSGWEVCGSYSGEVGLLVFNRSHGGNPF
jgi:hypothetical protein